MSEETPSPQTVPERKERQVSPFLWISLAIIGLTLAVPIGLAFVPRATMAHLRDIAVVLLVILLFFFLLLLLLLLGALIVAVRTLGARLDQVLQRGGAVLDELKGTAATVRGTAGFIGERLSSPWIRLSAWAEGVGQGVRTFFQGKKPSGGAQ
ncbi:MAG: hypothetical protein ACP5OO_06530 [Chloroflexia bacterium]